VLDQNEADNIAGPMPVARRWPKWRAIPAKLGDLPLSTTSQNAYCRIGAGQWANTKCVAMDVGDLHSAESNPREEAELDEKGDVVNGRGSPSQFSLRLHGAHGAVQVQVGGFAITLRSGDEQRVQQV
jgi:hypothetical protein